MKRRADLKDDRTLGAALTGNRNRALDGFLVTGYHDLAFGIVIRRFADLALRRVTRDGRNVLEGGTEDRGHRADANGNRFLHRLAAQF